MLNCLVNITITQKTAYVNGSGATVARDKVFTVPFCHSFEAYSTWKNLTDTATVVFPKNLYAVDENGKGYSLGSNPQDALRAGTVSSNKYTSSFPNTTNNAPLFMRGDRIVIQAGYYYPFQENYNGTLKYKTQMNTVFTGFISSVSSGIPITLKCEDNMWKMKQIAAPNKNFKAGTDNMGDILTSWVNTIDPSTGLTLSQMGFSFERAPSENDFSQLNIGNFRILNETWAKVFERLRKDHRLYFYFRGNILRGGGIVYYPQDQTTPINFYFPPLPTNIVITGNYVINTFGTPIIKSELDFKLKTDVLIGAVCYSVNSVKGSRVNAKGTFTQSTGRLTVNVPKGISKTDATEFFTFFFENVTTVDRLTALGTTQLQKYYYDGFHGKFTTFGLPTVIFGNIVNLSDTVLPERNGNYLVKGVKTSYSVDNGFRQEIETHFRTDNLTQQELNAGL